MHTTSLTRLAGVTAWGALAGAAIGAVVLFVAILQHGGAGLPGAAPFGGPFRLTTHEGRPYSSDSLEGRPYVIFFGFTNCPDVCPTTLLEMSNHLAALGADADRLAVLYVTIDPERDTAEHLKAYLASFDPRIIGLTGSPAEIAAVARAYHVFYEKVPTSSGYTMNHTATVYLVDAKGMLAGTTNHEESEAVQRQKLRRLLTR
jgi:protein SCO1